MAASFALSESSGRSAYRAPDGPLETDGTREAVRWLDSECRAGALPPLLIVIGLADGQLLDALQARAPLTKVLALEPDATAARAFSSSAHRTAWLRSGRLTYLAAPSYEGAADAWRLFPASGEGFALLTHPRLRPCPEVARAADVVKKIVFGVRANASARRRFAPRYLRNVIRNLPGVLRGRDAGALAGRYAHVPAVITAAGPSLDLALGELAAVQDRALIIATDTTLRPLLAGGIAPHLGVGADPGAANARHFHDLPPSPGTWLVAESALDRSAADAFRDRTLWFRLANHHPWPWLREHGVDVMQLEMWGSVLTAAFEVACRAGCNPIVIVGADLAFTGGRPYCRGTTYEFDWAFSVASGQSLEETWRAQMSRSEVTQVRDLAGRETTSTAALLSFRDWMRARIVKSGRRVVNATGAGLLYGDGIEQSTLTAALSGSATLGPVAAIRGVTTPKGSVGRIHAGLERIRQGLSRGAPYDEPLGSWAAFSGEGFDVESLAVALDDAAAGFMGSGVRGEAEMCATATGGSGQRPVAFLAEASARWLAVLQNRTDLPAPVAPVDAPALVRSLHLIGEVRQAARGLDQLVERHGGIAWLDAPVAVAYEWPERLRWRVQQFEAVLGNACGCGSPAARSSFLSATHAWQMRRETAPDAATTITTALVRMTTAWARCVATRSAVDGAAPDRAGPAAWSRAIERLVALGAARERSRPPDRPLHLHLSARAGDETALVTIPLVVGSDSLARALTGVGGTTGDDIALGSVTAGGLTASVTIGPHAEPRATAARVLDAPSRVLTSESLGPSAVAYAAPAGVVCVTPYERRSLIIGGGGVAATHLEWPHPIVGELPFGDGGAVAWSNGMREATSAGPCVMYRRRADEAPIVEALDVRPVHGAWWQGRLYWSCLPTELDTWVGVASWAPGEPARRELAGVTAIGLHPRSDGLRLDPCVFRPFVGYERRRFEEAWLWNGRDTRTLPLGPEGVLASEACADEWMASAYPDADLVRFESADGITRDMTCRCPRFLAWTNGNLIVSTVEREVLLFPDVRGLLDEWRRSDRRREAAAPQPRVRLSA